MLALFLYAITQRGTKSLSIAFTRPTGKDFLLYWSHNSRIRPKKRSLLRKRIRYPFPSILSPLTERDHSQLAKRISCRGKLSTARKAQNRTTHKSERSREDWPVNPVETNESRERRGRGKGRGPWAPGARMWAHRPS